MVGQGRVGMEGGDGTAGQGMVGMEGGDGTAGQGRVGMEGGYGTEGKGRHGGRRWHSRAGDGWIVVGQAGTGPKFLSAVESVAAAMSTQCQQVSAQVSSVASAQRSAVVSA